ACCEPVFEIASADFVSLAMTGEAIGTSCLLAMTKMAILTQSVRGNDSVGILLYANILPTNYELSTMN
ncbi:MAG: hypothetical protein Q8O01_04135, partial [Candidatus Omnitrophota bacterium]|nr:hypothetical protein [Candidatus Omnitrophota bacterium]